MGKKIGSGGAAAANAAVTAESTPQSAQTEHSTPSSQEDDPKWASIITPGDGGQLVLIGFPHDEGVRRNGGRVGAKDGPDVVRTFLSKIGTVINPEHGIDLNSIEISDFGNISPSLTLENAHKELRQTVSKLIEHNAIPLVLGGGNDQSYANAAGLLDQYHNASSVGVINIDAHLDVRPLLAGDVAHSGSPFRQLLEDERFDGRNFVEFVAQGQQCSAKHAAYVKEKKGRIVYMSNIRSGTAAERFKEELDNMAASCAAIFVSFDLDAISGADAPGVSAVATYGLSSRDALEIAFQAGSHDKVCMLDVSEFNPAVEAYRTGRLVANIAYYFALGVATRLGAR